MSGIASEICKLAAELADQVEKEREATKFGHFEMKFSWPQDPYNCAGMSCPVTLIYRAEWLEGEWKFTKRERIEELA